MQRTGWVSVLDRPLVLELWPQDAPSDSQGQPRYIHFVALFSFGVIDEAALADKQGPQKMGYCVLTT